MTSKATVRDQFVAAFEEAVKIDNLCPVGKLVSEHEAGDIIKEKVDDVLHYSGTTISRVLKTLGVPPVSVEAINKHRKGACRCLG